MGRTAEYDAAVVGSGPNGLAAAILLAQHGLKVVILEGAPSAGGAVRSGTLTLPGFIHDTGAAILPMALASPFFASLPLSEFGLKWIMPPASLAHPFDDGTAAVLRTSVSGTGQTLGKDGASYIRLIQPLASRWPQLSRDLLGTMKFPAHPLTALIFSRTAFHSAQGLVREHFQDESAKGFFAGLAAHSVIPLEMRPSAAYGVVMCLTGHAVGWPIPAGGAGSLSAALGRYFGSLGGKIITGHSVRSPDDLPEADAVFYDTSPGAMGKIYAGRLPGRYAGALKNYRYGPGVYKMDWALSGPIPWKSAVCHEAGTVHLGGTYAEIAESELSAWQGRAQSSPFVILAQPSLFDPSRAPSGKHTAWAYCHVPNGFSGDMTTQMEKQIERFAPGFRDLIAARHVSTPAGLETENPNIVGGDITGGAQTLKQLLCRPVCSAVPYSTPIKGVFLCSASTPPGAGVHGMCGFHAAKVYLRSRHHEPME
jgi:phytoene dehydrogenase-like protein